MAELLYDVLTHEGPTETGLHFSMRERMIGFAEDTRKMIHRYADGSVEKYTPDSLMNIYGQTGIQGPPGNDGISGDTGIQGETGIQGLQGTQGDTGLQGVQGAQGPTGPQGLQGLTGPQGAQGIQGPTGQQGPQGLQGLTGPQGPTGSQGIQGDTGVQGIQGATGVGYLNDYMRINANGALQVKMTNNSGGSIASSWLLESNPNGTYPRGIKKAPAGSDKIVGIWDDSSPTSNGSDCWVTVKGKTVLNFDSSMLPSIGDKFGVNWYEDGDGYAMHLLSNTKGMGHVLTGSTGTLNASDVFFNGPIEGQSGYTELPIVGIDNSGTVYASTTVTIDGGTVTLNIGPYLYPGVGTTLGLVLPGALRPSNGSVTLPIASNNVFENNGSYLTDNLIFGEYDSSDLTLYFKNWTGGTQVGWSGTGDRGWGTRITISYSLLSSI